MRKVLMEKEWETDGEKMRTGNLKKKKVDFEMVNVAKCPSCLVLLHICQLSFFF